MIFSIRGIILYAHFCIVCVIPKNSALKRAFLIKLLKYLPKYSFAVHELQVQVFASSFPRPFPFDVITLILVNIMLISYFSCFSIQFVGFLLYLLLPYFPLFIIMTSLAIFDTVAAFPFIFHIFCVSLVYPSSLLPPIHLQHFYHSPSVFFLNLLPAEIFP